MGIRQFRAITSAEAGRSPAHWVAAPEPQAARSAGQQGLRTAGIAAPGRIADPQAQARTLAWASGGRLAGAGVALLQLQRCYGNRYVQQLISAARQATDPPAAPAPQAKLVVGPPGDEYEREADRVAGQAVRLPAVRRQQRAETDTAGVQAGPDRQPPRGRAVVPGGLKRAMPAAGAPGRSLPGPLKEEFEAAFGADFGAVRVHTGDQAAQLSRGLQAQAFTHGPDVFFGAGRYAPDTAAGRRLLAHELTHVVQQGGAPKRDPARYGRSTIPVVPAPRGDAAPGGSAGLIQRKLSWKNTQWEKAKSAWASGGGTVGVVFVTDERKAPPPTDKPVVVKTGEEAPAEVLLAANLHPPRKGGKWRTKAPGVRTVPPGEGQQIKEQVGQRVLGGGRSDWETGTDRAGKIISQAGQPGTMVFEYARGEEFKDLIEQLRPLQAKDSPLSFFKDEDFVTSLGRVAAIDIFTGNYDRLAANKMNPENFKIYKNQILLIDNVFAKEPASAFKSTSGNGQGATGYDAWTGRRWTGMLRDADFGGIAEALIQSIETGMQITIRLMTETGEMEPGDKKTIEDALKKTKNWLMLGLKEGYVWLQAAGAGDLGQLTRGIDPEDVGEVQASIKKRMTSLFPDLGAEFERREKKRFAFENEPPESVTTIPQVTTGRRRAPGQGQGELELIGGTYKLNRGLVRGFAKIPKGTQITVLEIFPAENRAVISLPDGAKADVELDKLKDAIGPRLG